MDIESFRRDGHRLIDWIAEYLAHPERYPVLAQVEPGQVKRTLSKEAPEKPEPVGCQDLVPMWGVHTPRRLDRP